ASRGTPGDQVAARDVLRVGDGHAARLLARRERPLRTRDPDADRPRGVVASPLGARHEVDRRVDPLASEEIVAAVCRVADRLTLRLARRWHGDGLGVEHVLEGARPRAAKLPDAPAGAARQPRAAW